MFVCGYMYVWVDGLSAHICVVLQTKSTNMLTVVGKVPAKTL